MAMHQPEDGQLAGSEKCPARKGASAEDISDGGETRCTANSSCQDHQDADSTAESDGQGECPEDAQEDEPRSSVEALASAASPELVEALQFYGYFAQDGTRWRDQTMPVVRLRVKVHAEVDGHTCYMVECQLARLGEGQAPLSWSTLRRLKHLRAGLHDPLKRQLSEEYEKHFSATPFACRSGPPGTTSRLHAWFQSLAACMTAGYLSPVLTAHVLQMLEAPRPKSTESTPVAHSPDDSP